MPDDSASGERPESSLTVIIAFGANLLVAIAKTIASLISGSASMVAEAAHSWADTGNEIFLLVAERRGARKRDTAHPLGYGRETYIWSMFAAFGLFTAGAIVSIYHGISELGETGPAEDVLLNYIVLALSFCLEGTSFLQAYRQAHGAATKRKVPVLRHVLQSSNPTLRAVFAEDAAALIGLVVAFLGVFLHQVTGLAIFDAIGSIAIGLLLGVVAIILIDRNRRFLLGESTSPELENAVLVELLGRSQIERVTYLHLEFVGPSRVYLVAAVDLTGNENEEHVAVRLRDVEKSLEDSPYIEEAVLTLSYPGDASLRPTSDEVPEVVRDGTASDVAAGGAGTLRTD
ncbi:MULTISPECIES: cation diffusion facilitator family transporter [unclassified Curtobacterium]|uniref:cation diffusion facilitator family transporter n=1 Tax=unclassified Curtobacterium TaxID=257496 RepID=UPI00104D775C|nr:MULTISPECIES: cation diffusion facilitator family transporter [unclassified Curtobacterium]TCL78201.1 cation diffusion facilitator family transporter [Curtobacterium sp. PhB128]TCL87717.1 cation diffusion facilitator family transporter [Curtobacterium sp. PhB142]TCL94926.1 cation diffusion facilitator family transporter [Curtobacterium sp. PhB138]TCM04934.1 cation diffusion facilitator family transporter [Curtobacterium sp. PhB134]